MEYSVYEDKRSGSFATAALVLGIVGLATGCCIYTGVICGALAVLFAILSKGGETTMSSRGKTGLTLGIIAIVASILLFFVALVYSIALYGGLDSFMDYYNDILQQMEYGYPTDLL